MRHAPRVSDTQRAAMAARAPSGHAPLSRFLLSPSRTAVQRKCDGCEDKDKALQTKLAVSEPGDALEREADAVADAVTASSAGGTRPWSGAPVLQPAERGALPDDTPATVRDVLRAPGRPLDAQSRGFAEERFGVDFSHIRIHDGAAADAAAQSIAARAFARGPDIVFAANQFRPSSAAGRHLLAHELTHTLQQSAGTGPAAQASAPLARTGSTCPADWETTVAADKAVALARMDSAIAQLAAYDGTNPAKVFNALKTHFGTTSNAFAGLLNIHLRTVRLFAPAAGYKCSDKGEGSCDENTNAWAAWCVPLFDIRVCSPNYFAQDDARRATTLIHEWFHKYDCRLDTGYEGSEAYPDSPLGGLLNADNFAKLIRDVV